jgi:hypothetical protein
MTAVEHPAATRRLPLAAWRRTTEDDRHVGPVVVEHAVDGTACSPELLAASFGDLDVSVRRRRGPRVVLDRATLGGFVATMDPEVVYFAPAIPFDHLPGLLDRLGLARLFPTTQAWEDAAGYARLHVGDAMRMRMHWEPTDLLLAQLHGRARVVAEPPDSTAALYLSSGWPTASRVDVDDPGHAADFPRHTGEGRIVTVLEPGDVLHIPRGWWYQARAEGRAVWATVAHGPVLPLSDEVRDRLLTLAGRTA